MKVEHLWKQWNILNNLVKYWKSRTCHWSMKRIRAYNQWMHAIKHIYTSFVNIFANELVRTGLSCFFYLSVSFTFFFGCFYRYVAYVILYHVPIKLLKKKNSYAYAWAEKKSYPKIYHKLTHTQNKNRMKLIMLWIFLCSACFECERF